MAVVAAETNKFGGMKHKVESKGTLVFSGTYPTGGEPVVIPKPGTTKEPYLVTIQGMGVNSYKYDYVNKKILVFTPTAEVSAGAMPAGVTADVINYWAVFPRLG